MMHSNGEEEEVFAASELLHTDEVPVGFSVPKTTLSDTTDQKLGRLAAVAAVACCLALLACLSGAEATAGVGGVASNATVTLGAAFLTEGGQRISREELARRLGQLSLRLRSRTGSGTIGLLEDNSDLIGIKSARNPDKSKKLLLDELRPLVLPSSFLVDHPPQLDRSEEEIAFMHGDCGISAENIVYSLGMAGLSVDGMAKICPKPGKKIECAAFFTNFLTEICWVASNALSMPEDCGLRDVEGANCGSQGMYFVANTFQTVTDGLAIDINCVEQEGVPVQAGERRLRGLNKSEMLQAKARHGNVSTSSVSTNVSQGSTNENVLQVLGLVKRRRMMLPMLRTTGIKDVDDNGTEDAMPIPPMEQTLPRAFDISACYLDAENTASTAVDAIFSVINAVKACEEFEKNSSALEEQLGCAELISNFIADLSAMATNALIMAATCPVTSPAAKVECGADFTDLTSVLASFATWGSSFGPDCLGVDN